MGDIKNYQMLINGDWVDASDGGTFDSVNPSTGEIWSRVPEATEADVNRAVETAHEAFNKGAWAKMTPTERGKCLRKLGDLLAGELAFARFTTLRGAAGEGERLRPGARFAASLACLPQNTWSSIMPKSLKLSLRSHVKQRKHALCRLSSPMSICSSAYTDLLHTRHFVVVP